MKNHIKHKYIIIIMFIQKIKISTNMSNIDDYKVYFTDCDDDNRIILTFDKAFNEFIIYRKFSQYSSNDVILTFTPLDI